MKLIPLTQGKFAMVDDCNYDWLMQWRWYANKGRSDKTFYARRNGTVNGKRITILMHREILGATKDAMIDHIDHNGLNCLMENLRPCTQQENMKNISPRGKSKYLGVSCKRNIFIAQICTSGEVLYLGSFKIEEEAAKRYDVAAAFFHGEFANLNIIK